MPSPLADFELELARLKALYWAASSTLRIVADGAKEDKADMSAPVYGTDAEGNPIQLAGTAFSFCRRAKTMFPKYLRETIFVRLISAFEAYLIDALRHVFLTHRHLFYSDQKIDFTVEEVLSTTSISRLWSKVIKGDLRRLTSKGFEEICRYYLRLGIQLQFGGVSKETLQELHDRRHLLVHRYGKTDEKYRHQYGSDLATVTVTEEGLIKAASLLQAAARGISTDISRIRDSTRPAQTTTGQGQLRMRIRLRIRTQRGRMFVSREFRYSVDEGIARLAETLTSHYRRANFHDLILEGDPEYIRQYQKTIKRAQLKGDVEIISCDYLKTFADGIAPPRVDPAIVDRVRHWVSDPPWPIGIHREVAAALKIRNSEAWDALSIIKSELYASQEWTQIDDDNPQEE